MNEERTCTKCNKTKSTSEFSYSTKNKEYNVQCLSCAISRKRHKKQTNYNETRRLNYEAKKDYL